MAKRRTRAEIREEYVRLLEIFGHVRAFEIEQDKAAGELDTAELIPDTPTLLELFDQRQAPASELLLGVQQGLNDWLVGLPDALAHEEQTALEFVAFYKKSSGRDFFDDMGDPMKRVKAILKRGRIVSTEEYYIVKLALDEQLESLSEPMEIKANSMINMYEKSV